MAESKAYTKFQKSITRSITLIRDYRRLRKLKKKKAIIRAPKDLIRASVILSVASLDAYITEVFTEKLIPYIKKYNPDETLINILCESGLDTKEALNLIKMKRPHSRIRNLVDRYYDTYTTQRFEVIDNLFLAYRLKDITNMAQAKSTRKTLKRSVEILVERRHKIAHDGDYNSHKKLTNIYPTQIERRINDLQLFVHHLDEIINNRI